MFLMLLRSGSLCKASTIMSVRPVGFSLIKHELNLLPFLTTVCVHMLLLPPQILELTEEPRDLPPKFNEVYHQLALPPLPLHCCLCSAGHAALWRTVSDLSCPTQMHISSLFIPLPLPRPGACSLAHCGSTDRPVCTAGRRHSGAAG